MSRNGSVADGVPTLTAVHPTATRKVVLDLPAVDYATNVWLLGTGTNVSGACQVLGCMTTLLSMTERPLGGFMEYFVSSIAVISSVMDPKHLAVNDKRVCRLQCDLIRYENEKGKLGQIWRQMAHIVGLG